MGRVSRTLHSNVVHHIYNRRTDRQCLFSDADAYDDFLDVVRRANQRYEARLHAYCLLHSHFHFAVSAETPETIARYVRWISGTHAIRFRLQTGTRGNGHVYQDRYKSKPVDGAVHYTTLIRYIERNPLEAGIVARAEDWKWSSLQERLSGRADLIQPGPYTLPEGWCDVVNTVSIDISQLPSLLGQLSRFQRPQHTFSRTVPELD